MAPHLDISGDVVQIPGHCSKQPHDGPKVMVHCMQPPGHRTPHDWEKAGYTRAGQWVPAA